MYVKSTRQTSKVLAREFETQYRKKVCESVLLGKRESVELEEALKGDTANQAALGGNRALPPAESARDADPSELIDELKAAEESGRSIVVEG